MKVSACNMLVRMRLWVLLCGGRKTGIWLLVTSQLLDTSSAKGDGIESCHLTSPIGSSLGLNRGLAIPERLVNLATTGFRRLEELTHSATVDWSINKGHKGLNRRVQWQVVAKISARMLLLESKMAKLQFAHGNRCAARLLKHSVVSPVCQLCVDHGTMSHRVFWCP
eukprot:4886176-Amphidinium_carterae.1